MYISNVQVKIESFLETYWSLCLQGDAVCPVFLDRARFVDALPVCVSSMFRGGSFFLVFPVQY